MNGESGPLLTGEINSGTSTCVGGRQGECSPHLLGALQLLPHPQGKGRGRNGWNSLSGHQRAVW